MADSVGTTAWRYDDMGRLVGESGPFGTPEVQVAYDPNGRLTNVTWGAFSVDYSFDDLGRIVAVAAPEGTYAFTYLSNGIRRATVAYPNGVTEIRAHDELVRCTSLAFLSGTNPLLSIAYAYDDGDRRTNEVWSTGRAMAYGYDDANQLTSVAASRPSDAARYRYDAAGNPVDRAEFGLDVTNSFNNLNQIVSGSWTGSTVTVAGFVNYPAGSITVNNTPGTIYPDASFDVAGVPVAPGTNTLTATYTGPAFTNVPMTATDTSTVVLGDTFYTHDANGNLTSDATFLYQYDLANQLTNVIRKSDSASVLSCRYDALGRRVEAIRADGTVDRYVYFPGTFLVLAVLDGNNAPKELYTRGPDLSGSLASAGGIGGILACTYSNAPSAPLYHHADLMGNIVFLTAVDGVVAEKFRYTPFGQLLFHVESRSSRYLFGTKEWETDTGLIYYRYRYYSMHCGRWLTRDPLREPFVPDSMWHTQTESGENWAREPEFEAFCNNPVKHADAWGLTSYSDNIRWSFVVLYRETGLRGVILKRTKSRRLTSNGSTYSFPERIRPCWKAFLFVVQAVPKNNQKLLPTPSKDRDSQWRVFEYNHGEYGKLRYAPNITIKTSSGVDHSPDELWHADQANAMTLGDRGWSYRYEIRKGINLWSYSSMTIWVTTWTHVYHGNSDSEYDEPKITRTFEMAEDIGNE